MGFSLTEVLAAAALAAAVYTIFSTSISKSVSLREHVEFKEHVEQELRSVDTRLPAKEHDEWKKQFLREIDMIREEIKIVESKVPTQGELNVAIRSIEVRLNSMEVRLNSHIASHAIH